jgi:hypothetical protein
MKIAAETDALNLFWRSALAVELLDFSFDLAETEGQRRRSYRVRFPGLTVWVPERNAYYPVIDLSTFGVSFRDVDKRYSMGQVLVVDINIQGKVWVSGLKAKVVRIKEDVQVACNFEELSTSQEIRMDKLSIEIQKRWIEHRKRQKQQGEDEKDSNQT